MPIDLRSDTLTKPTDQMRKAMAEAEVGDDVAREDPTVRRLEELAAELLNKPEALFISSGTMGNLLGILTQTAHARCLEIICEQKSHIITNESAGSAVVAGVQTRGIAGELGMMPVKAIEAAIRLDGDIHHPQTALICLETTHNFAGGVALPLEYMKQVREVAGTHGLPVHIDGARLFNAAAALDVNPADIARFGDTVTVCLSKGLSAPVGAIFASSSENIALARRYRKMLGGGLRQSGIIAAAGIMALTEMTDRLKEDHALAKKLAEGLREIRGVEIDMRAVQTNIVIFDVTGLGLDAEAFVERMKAEGVLCYNVSASEARFVTHRHVTAKDVDDTLMAVKKLAR